MKRYTRDEMTDDAKMALLDEMGEVKEIVGGTARIITQEGRVLDISTLYWYELKEAE